MGMHSVDKNPLLHNAGLWVLAHRRKIASVALIAVPVLARYFPGFPTEEVVSVARMFLGA